MTPLRLLDLFSGVGAFSLGLERSGGFKTAAFCEIDPFCRAVLDRHWPEVPKYDDVRSLTAERLAADGIVVDAICGGFPCQDISAAGKGAGIAGERSGLWTEFARIIGELRPGYVIVENVSALLGRGLDVVLGDLAALGFDAEWHCVPASAIGAPHRRDRIWIVAYPMLDGPQGSEPPGAPDMRRRPVDESSAHVAYPNGGRRLGEREPQHAELGRSPGHQPDRCGAQGRRAREDLADTEDERPARRHDEPGRRAPGEPERRGEGIPFARGARLPLGPGTLAEWAHATATGAGWWATEPDVGRVVDGFAARMDCIGGVPLEGVPQAESLAAARTLRRRRLMALGNSLVPATAEIIGRAIVEIMIT